MTTKKTITVTEQDVISLIESPAMEPQMILWKNTNEIEIWSKVTLTNDVSFSEKGREYATITDQAELENILSEHYEGDEPDRFQSLADYLNEGLDERIS